jgi:ubiquitin-activating enzyme E1
MKNKQKIKNILDELDKINEKNYDNSKINPETFEKDHDENGHKNFIRTNVNIRARNYNINECNRNKTKIISRKIIPKSLIITVAIAGITSLQDYILL